MIIIAKNNDLMMSMIITKKVNDEHDYELSDDNDDEEH